VLIPDCFCAAFFTTIVPAAGLFAQAKEATAAAKKYLAAIEGLQFKAAYDLLVPDDRAAKTLAQYQDENPPVFIKALRKADKNYFKYAVTDAKIAGNEVQLSVTTRDIALPNQGDQEFPIGQLYSMVKAQMQKNKQKVDDPDQFLLALKKFFADNGLKELPFASVTRVVRMQKIKTAWLVKKGWQEAALKQQQEMQEQAIVNEAQNWVRNVLSGGSKSVVGWTRCRNFKKRHPGTPP